MVIIGLKNPLSCSNIRDGGTYVVNRGNQCLAAIMKMDEIEDVSCLVAVDEDQEYVPDGRYIMNMEELESLHPNGIQRVVDNKDCFQVVPKGTDNWDPDKVL